MSDLGTEARIHQLLNEIRGAFGDGGDIGPQEILPGFIRPNAIAYHKDQNQVSFNSYGTRGTFAAPSTSVLSVFNPEMPYWLSDNNTDDKRSGLFSGRINIVDEADVTAKVLGLASYTLPSGKPAFLYLKRTGDPTYAYSFVGYPLPTAIAAKDFPTLAPDFTTVMSSDRVPSKGQITLLGVYPNDSTAIANQWAMCGINGCDGYCYLLFYSLSTGALEIPSAIPSGNFSDLYESGPDRTGYPRLLNGLITSATGFGLRLPYNIIAEFRRWESHPGSAGSLDAFELVSQALYSPLHYDNVRNVYYYIPNPCYFWGSGPAHSNLQAQGRTNRRLVIVLDADEPQKKLGSFYLNSEPTEEQNYQVVEIGGSGGGLNVERALIPVQHDLILGNSGNPQSTGLISGGTTVQPSEKDVYDLHTNPFVPQGTALGFRNIILAQDKSLYIDSTLKTNQTVLIEAGRNVYHIPDEYNPNP